MYYKGSQLNPSAFSYTNFPQNGRNFAAGDTWVVSPRLVNEIRFGYNYAYHLNSPISLDDRNWVGRHRDAQPGRRHRSDRLRPSRLHDDRLHRERRGGITQGATENIFSVSNATSWVQGRHNVRFGIQAQFRRVRPADRGAAARQLHVQRTVHRQSGRRLPARLLLDVHRRVRQLAVELPLADLSRRSSTTTGRFRQCLTLQMGLRWEYLGPWHEQNNQEGSFDPATGKIALHVVPTNLPAEAGPAGHQPGRLLP